MNAPAETVRAVAGSIEEVVSIAREAAGDKNVYIDGGRMIRQAFDADLIDAITLTIVPAVLGSGVPLFAGVSSVRKLTLLSSRPMGAGTVELRYSCR